MCNADALIAVKLSKTFVFHANTLCRLKLQNGIKNTDAAAKQKQQQKKQCNQFTNGGKHYQKISDAINSARYCSSLFDALTAKLIEV